MAYYSSGNTSVLEISGGRCGVKAKQPETRKDGKSATLAHQAGKSSSQEEKEMQIVAAAAAGWSETMVLKLAS